MVLVLRECVVPVQLVPDDTFARVGRSSPRQLDVGGRRRAGTEVCGLAGN